MIKSRLEQFIGGEFGRVGIKQLGPLVYAGGGAVGKKVDMKKLMVGEEWSREKTNIRCEFEVRSARKYP